MIAKLPAAGAAQAGCIAQVALYEPREEQILRYARGVLREAQ